MDPWDLLNWVATAAFILCLVPQLLRTLRTRHADDISRRFLFLVLFASVCMFAYTMHTRNYVFAVAQLVNLVVWGIVLAIRLGVGAGPHPPGL